MKDKQKLNEAFKDLRKRLNFYAFQGHLCCQTCACADIENRIGQDKDKRDGYVFYHRQDKRSFGNGYVYLSYGTTDIKGDTPIKATMIGSCVAEALTRAGLKYEWSGTNKERIKVIIEGSYDN